MSSTNLRMSRAPWIPADGRASFDRLFGRTDHRVAARREVPADLVDPKDALVLTSGIDARIRRLPDGRRHVASIVVPGDVCDFAFLHGIPSDLTLVAASTCTFASATPSELQGAPYAYRALWWEAAVEHRAQVNWAATLGADGCRARVPHGVPPRWS